jgi:hypothetical protein
MCYKVLTCNMCHNTNCCWIDYCKFLVAQICWNVFPDSSPQGPQHVWVAIEKISAINACTYVLEWFLWIAL